MLRNIVGVISVLVSITYVVGFLFDTAFLEQFQFAHYELIGNPLDYFAIGGMYLLFNFTKHLTVIGIIVALIGIGYMPIKRKLNLNIIKRYIDVESIPYVIFGTLPLFFIVIVPVIKDALASAEQFKSSEIREEICVAYQEGCFKGIVLRYRDAKVIFLSKDKGSLNSTLVIPEKQITNIRSL